LVRLRSHVEESIRSQTVSEAGAGSPDLRRRRLRPAIVAAGLFAFTLVLRGAQLRHPNVFVFDEVFYANDALDIFTHGVEQTFVGHPPLAKWLIAAGFVFGEFSPLTWRLSALVAGAVVVALTFVVGRRATRSTPLGIAAAVLVLTDGIAHFAGRYALLDGFTALFVLGTVAYLVHSKRPASYSTAGIAGALVGATLATKWSVAPLLGVAVLVVAARAGNDARVLRRLALGATVVGLALVGYLGSYAPWVIAGGKSGNCVAEACEDGPFRRALLLPSIHRDMVDSQVALDRGSTDQMEAGWHWLLQDKNITLFGEQCRGQEDAVCTPESRSLVAVAVRGNSVIWLIWLPLLVVWLVRRRRLRGEPSAVPVLALTAVALWTPWIFFAKTFPFYAAPIVPLIALADVAMMRELLPRRTQPLILGAVIVAATVVYIAERHGAPWAA
jgi:dolichyl-phosphate-mannose-protein mannosyltransferase